MHFAKRKKEFDSLQRIDFELYNLKSDLGETNDLAVSNPERLQEMYNEPEKLPDEIKSQVSKKITKTKSDLRKLYSDPIGSIDPARIQKWAGIQVIKAFLGMPIIPGK